MNGANHNVAACALVQAPLGQKVVVAANLFVKFGSHAGFRKNVVFSTARRRAVTNLRLGERISFVRCARPGCWGITELGNFGVGNSGQISLGGKQGLLLGAVQSCGVKGAGQIGQEHPVAF